MSITQHRRQYDFCRHRLYLPLTKGAYLLNDVIKQNLIKKKDDTICLKTWRNGIRHLQKTDIVYKKWIDTIQKVEPDYVKILHLGICALEKLSGLCQTGTLPIIDHSRSLWSYTCRMYYENPYQTSCYMSYIKHIRSIIDKFLAEQCSISDNSTCPTTITASTYRLECLHHKLSSLACVFYRAMLNSNGNFDHFRHYIQEHCDVDPSFLISHIITTYTHLLGSSSPIYPHRDGQCILRLFNYLLHLTNIEPGICDTSTTNGYEILKIQEEIPIFTTYLFGLK
jgi:hypothetical protein